MMDKVPMTAGGYAALTDELKRRQSEDRPRIIEHIAEARSHGDLSENAEYHAAKERQGWIEGRIAEIEDKISRAQVIDVSKLSGSQVKFGATVTVVDEDTEEEATYQIVGEHEADVKKGKISIASPIARAMISKEVGDVVEVDAQPEDLGDGGAPPDDVQQALVVDGAPVDIVVNGQVVGTGQIVTVAGQKACEIRTLFGDG